MENPAGILSLCGGAPGRRESPQVDTNMNEFPHFTQLLGDIPATFWGVVVGSLFTLAGIYLTNRANDHRLRVEREMTFSKETYAVAAEASSVSISYLAKFSDLCF